MPQLRKVEDAALFERLSRTFKDVGYEGASLSLISDATGLKKSSLYHRFPDGKEQMAQEVLGEVVAALEAELFPVLDSALSPDRKMASFVKVMDAFYASGQQSCLLNTLSPPRDAGGPRAEAITAIFRRLLEALAVVARQAGATPAQARLRAEQALVMLQGALVVARGAGDPAVFRRALGQIPGVVLG